MGRDRDVWQALVDGGSGPGSELQRRAGLLRLIAGEHVVDADPALAIALVAAQREAKYELLHATVLQLATELEQAAADFAETGGLEPWVDRFASAVVALREAAGGRSGVRAVQSVMDARLVEGRAVPAEPIPGVEP